MQVHQLERSLKKLKLGGMLATLQQRLEQAQGQQLGYLEFLVLLLEDEIARRGQKGLAAALIRDLATLRFLQRQESVLIRGPVGAGNSHVAQALGFLACRQGRRVRYAKTPRLLAGLGGGRADGTYGARLRGYLGPELLILDDFGLQAFAATQSEDLYQLICERYLRRSTIAVANRPPQEWYALFADPVLAEVAPGRPVNAAHHVLMDGRSYRPRKRPGSAPAPTLDPTGEVMPQA